MSIKDAISARQKAEECIELLRSVTGELDNDAQVNRFWETIHAKAAEIGGIVTEEPGDELIMCDTEAAIFEMSRIKFGMHEGEFICDIPRDYLEWQEDHRRTDKFWNDLTRYLRSGHGEAHGE
jgi:hypothetical protein